MSYSKEQEASDEVLAHVDFDPVRLAALITRVREKRGIPNWLPVMMTEVREFIREEDRLAREMAAV